ncbi:MAG: hypothetical protein U1G07_12925 [Verrucomicrobiota bacterium]
MNPKALCQLALAWVCLAGNLPIAQAQWVKQTLDLKAGWNAVFLHVDPSHTTLDDLLADEATSIEEVWRWNPNPSSGQFVTSPQNPVDTGSQWTSWRRDQAATSPLRRLSANAAYLVRASADTSWVLAGKPVLPSYQWTTSGMNLIGFATAPVAPPTFQDFFSPSATLLAAEVFRYQGGTLGTTNPIRVTTLRSTPVRRGEAFWVRAGQAFNDFYGPFEVTALPSGQVRFGDTLSSQSFRIRNRTAAALTVSLRLDASQAPPTGQPAIAGTPPLLVRGDRNATNLTYSSSGLAPNASKSWVLQPSGSLGSEVEIVLGLDRSASAAPAGSFLAGVLTLTDSIGQSRLEMGVTATVGSKAGLWVGAAAVTEVGQYLQSYLRDGSNQLVVQSNGAYVVTEVVTNLTPVPAAYPLKLIVHNPASGPATLLQRVYFGFNALTNPVVATQEGVLLRDQMASARRISASHLPWSEANAGWSFSGGLAAGALITAKVTNDFNQRVSNPFLHTYHPDHDNLDPSFKTELAQGAESYTIERELTLDFRPPADDFNSRVNAGLSLTGEYLETFRLRGLARAGNVTDTRRFDVRGSVTLNRVSEIPTLTRVP